MKNENKKLIAVFGGRIASEKQLEQAYLLGKGIAEKQWILLCGGRGGIMEAVCKGCSSADGFSIGILPGMDRSDANEYASITLPTGIGFARNSVLAASCNAAVAVGGKYGTLSEIAYALDYGRPILTLDSWDIPGAKKMRDAQAAIKYLDEIFKL